MGVRWRILVLRVWGEVGAGAVEDREGEVELGSALREVFGGEVAVVGAGHVAGHGEAHAVTGSGVIAPAEALKEDGKIAVGDAGAPVGHGHA